jgi:hypothetical protein
MHRPPDRLPSLRGRPTVPNWLDIPQIKARRTRATPCACVNALLVGVMPRAPLVRHANLPLLLPEFGWSFRRHQGYRSRERCRDTCSCRHSARRQRVSRRRDLGSRPEGVSSGQALPALTEPLFSHHCRQVGALSAQCLFVVSRINVTSAPNGDLAYPSVGSSG